MYMRTTSIHASHRKRTHLTGSRIRRSRLLTEVAMRKMNQDPEKTERMESISEQLSDEDISFFTHVFNQIDSDGIGIILRSELQEGLTLLGITATDKELDEYLLIADADGSKAIDVDEWIVLCAVLVKPPHDENQLFQAFHSLFPNEQDIPVVVFRTKMQRILENAYTHLPECNQHEVSCFVDDIIIALDPNNTECIDVQECIRILSAPYNSVPAGDTIVESAHEGTSSIAMADERAVELWREFVDSSVECELCNEPYEDDGPHVPRLLACGHTFCENCLEDWSSTGATASGATAAVVDCPTCRRTTTFEGPDGPRSLPKNFELLRVRHEIESQTQVQRARLRDVWSTQVLEKEAQAREAEAHAQQALRESQQAAARASFLAKQVEINEQEKKQAQDMAAALQHKALLASQQAEALQSETDSLKQQLRLEAAQLQQVQQDASSSAAVAAELHSRAEQLQEQVDRVRAQLSLHAGRHDPSKLVVLVCEPTTVGSWLLPYTRYAVISITSESFLAIDPFLAAKTWVQLHQVAEPSCSVKVYRRYSDFVWLHRELTRAFPFQFVPSLPAKQLLFNKEKEFVGERMRLLQAFLRQVLRDPRLSRCEEVRSFLLSTTEELEQLKQASNAHPGDAEALQLADELLDDPDHAGRPPLAPAAGGSASVAAAAAKQTSAWAWGAVSALTSTAAKLVTTTGTAISAGLGGASNAAGGASTPPDDHSSTPALSSSIDGSTIDVADAQLRQKIEKRRKYVDITQAYQSTIQKGTHVARKQRKQAQHLHRLCEYLHKLETLDEQDLRKRHHRLSASTRQRVADEEAKSCFEMPTFHARASEAFSAMSSTTRNDADCMEYALLEVMRMQTLKLGSIEDAFKRLRKREQALEKASSGSGPSSPPQNGFGGSDGASPSASLLLAKKDELQHKREDLMTQVNQVDPARSRFVLETIQKNVVEMHKLATERRRLYENTYQQVLHACQSR
ncbi:TPA: hypothetical protein N0F65_009531 [Lagenidium giganteum]|uniref:Calmodulin n=1 Tax=Lagenidium giganteum TaxID=4803 RepID=A0AAV2YUJ8_9STRA|nr:TPA: hypothetical protein N0F65_009531 [Lagenidium giganteum]